MAGHTMVKETIQTQRITFKTEPSENHVSFVSNRIWGGLQSGGLFELNFLLETKQVPTKLTMNIEPNGTQKEISRNTTDEILRKNQATAYLTLDTLLALQDWLNEKIDEMDKIGLIHKVDDVEDE